MYAHDRRTYRAVGLLQAAIPLIGGLCRRGKRAAGRKENV